MNNLGIHAEPKVRQATCDKHGDFESRCIIGEIWSRCPACSKEQVEREQAASEEKARIERLLAWQRRIGASGIPERFHDRSLENYDAQTAEQKRVLTFCQRYAADFDVVMRTGQSAIFLGRPGTGKTHLAAAIGLHVMREQNRTVLFTTVQRAIRRVKDSWNRDNNETESQAIATLVSPDLLILDEVGVQFGSDFERNVLFDVLNERYEKRRPYILLSNLNMETLTGFLGERVIDRIREDSGKLIPFGWESHRRG